MVHKLPFQVGRRADSDLVLPFGRVSPSTPVSSRARARYGCGTWAAPTAPSSTANGWSTTAGCRTATSSTSPITSSGWSASPLCSHRRRPRPSGSTSCNCRRTTSTVSAISGGCSRTTGCARCSSPLVNLADNSIMGYEVLGPRRHQRGRDAADRALLPRRGAGARGRAERGLSDKGVEEAGTLTGEPRIFVNSHPAELLRSDCCWPRSTACAGASRPVG